jgi:hypothetical protein
MLKCRMEYPNISTYLGRRQERMHLDHSMSGEDTYVRCGQWTHLHPSQRGCTSILCVRRGQQTHLDPSQERIEYTGTFTLHIRRGHTLILCRHGREAQRRWRWMNEKQRDAWKCQQIKGASVVDPPVSTMQPSHMIAAC